MNFIKKTCVYVCVACVFITSVLSCYNPEEITKAPVPDAKAYNNRGYAQGILGKRDEVMARYDKEIAKYDKAIALNPDDATAYFRRGIAKKVRELTIKTLEDTFEVNTDLTEGNADFAIAKVKYDKAIALNPNAKVYVLRGGAKGQLGRHEEAIADYDKAIALNPDDANVYFIRAMAKDDLGKYEEAIADYDKVIEIEPDDANAYYMRALVKEALGKHEEAEADYDKSKEIRNLAE